MRRRASSYSAFFCFIVMFSVVADIMSDIMAIHVFEFGVFSFTGGDFLFPVVYIINDIFTEVYGFRTAKRFIWYGFLINAFALGILTFVSSLAGEGAPIYSFIIGDSGIAAAVCVFVAGLVAYLFASYANAYIMSEMKKRDKEKRFWLRAIVSTLAAEFSDSAIFSVVMIIMGAWSFETAVSVTLTITAMKTIIEIILLPITNAVVNRVKRIEVAHDIS